MWVRLPPAPQNASDQHVPYAGFDTETAAGSKRAANRRRWREALTSIVDAGDFLWRAVRTLVGGFVLGFVGHLFGVAIGAAGYPTLAAAFLLVWTVGLGVGIVLWVARGSSTTGGPRC